MGRSFAGGHPRRAAANDLLSSRAGTLLTEFGIERIHALITRFELWDKLFDDWTDQEWIHPESLSALWNLRTSQVLWTTGATAVDDMHVGRPISVFFGFTD